MLPADDGLRRAPDPRLRHLIETHGSEEGVRFYVEELRWPEGVRCPRCESDELGWLEARRKYYCRTCGYQFRVTAGTIFHDSHISLERWLVAVQLMLDSESGFPAVRLQPVIGGSYKTAWFVEHRIRAAMSRSLLDPDTPVALAKTAAEADSDAAVQPVLVSSVAASEGWALVKSLVAGAYHRPSLEYLTSYWNEACWRAANIDNEHVFRETVCALLEAEPLQYEQLIRDAHRSSTVSASPS